MHPVLGYGPSLQDQGIGPEDYEPQEPKFVRVILGEYSSFIDKEGEPMNGENRMLLNLTAGRRLSIEEFIELERDLERLRVKYSRDPYRHLWVIRALFKGVEL